MVCLSVCHTSEPCKNGGADRDDVWIAGSRTQETMYKITVNMGATWQIRLNGLCSAAMQAVAIISVSNCFLSSAAAHVALMLRA